METEDKVRILVISSLYPNPASERHGIFVETRLRKILERGQVTAEVIAPVPWLPPILGWSARYAQYRGIPREETRHGIQVYHPRYVVLPKIGMILTPFFMAFSLLLCSRRLRKLGKRFDLVDGHYYYPDGVAVALISGVLNLPFTVTARGTDINLIPEKRLPRSLILWAARRAAASITVCSALKDRMVELGADGEKINVLRNGVDLDLFRPLERERCRERFGVSGTTLLSVGHLIERKGHHLAIEALAALPDCALLIAGDGEMHKQLVELAADKGVGDRVTFLGALTQKELAEVYNAADILVLASSREGWANVLLEAMACGTPVVATRIWGTPEVVRTPEAGRLVGERSAAAIAEQVEILLAAYPDRQATRRYAEQFSWDATVDGCHAVFSDVMGSRPLEAMQ